MKGEQAEKRKSKVKKHVKKKKEKLLLKKKWSRVILYVYHVRQNVQSKQKYKRHSFFNFLFSPHSRYLSAISESSTRRFFLFEISRAAIFLFYYDTTNHGDRGTNCTWRHDGATVNLYVRRFEGYVYLV